MIMRAPFWLCAAVATAMLLLARPAAATIEYSVSLARPEQHVLGISVRVPGVRDHLVLQMPAWNALYQIRDFSSHVMQVTARDEAGRLLPVAKLDKQTWQITGNGTITVNYPTYWDEPGPFNTQLNGDHGFVNLAMVLMYVTDRRAEDTRLVFEDLPESWRVAVALPESRAGDGNGYAAPTYDALADAPVELGRFEEFSLQAGGVPVRVVYHGDIGDRNRMADALTRIVNYQTGLMGGAPFRDYLFLFHVGSNFGGGGMEHDNSTAIAADAAAQLPSYSAHELFHAWNVKRIRPQSLEPVDHSREMWTRSLWFAEGVTSTYASYTMLRTGLWSTQQFYGNLSGQINDLISRPAHRWQSAEQSSLDAWLEKYSLYARPEQSISYYNKGQLLGVALDIVIRDATDNRASLDDLLRLLNVKYAQAGKYYGESEALREAAEQVLRSGGAAGRADLRDFFARYVRGTDEIPFSDLLGRAGWILKNTGARRAVFGFTTVRKGDGPVTIEALDPGSAAQKADLREGDVLVQLNGEDLPRFPSRWLRDRQPGETVTATIRRGGEERSVSFALGQSEATYQVVDSPEPTEKQRRIRDGILRGVTGTAR